MRVELRNGEVVEVADPRETKHVRAARALKERYGYWVYEYDDGVIVGKRWHPPVSERPQP